MSESDSSSSRIALGIEYDGTKFYGWQAQEKVPSIQTHLEAALAKVADHPIEVMCAGRTDKGVHALEQVVHFDTQVQRDRKAWLMGTNTHLPAAIRVLWVADVDNEFHARFSATHRQYRYLIYNNPVRSALLRAHATWHYRPLDAQKMHEAAQCLVGEHDFNAYRAAECQAKHAIREITDIRVEAQGSVIILEVSANGFLHHMVRNIVGVLLEIGEGEREIGWAQEVLDSKDRKQAGITASPQGLYLAKITYPDHYNLPQKTVKPLVLYNH